MDTTPEVRVVPPGDHEVDGTGRASGHVWSTFESFYEGDFEAVVGLVYALSGDGAIAEDLAQEAFLAAYKRWSKVSRYDDPGAWVRRVAVNRAVSAARRATVARRGLRRIEAAERPVPELSPTSAAVWEAVRRLPKRQAQVVALHYVEDRPLEDVAAILGVSVHTARTHLRRARRTLAHRLESPEEEA